MAEKRVSVAVKWDRRRGYDLYAFCQFQIGLLNKMSKITTSMAFCNAFWPFLRS
jgi:hypothetical protein